MSAGISGHAQTNDDTTMSRTVERTHETHETVEPVKKFSARDKYIILKNVYLDKSSKR